MASLHSCDIAIVGGGLAGGLIAMALARKRPDVRIRLIEAGDTLGGNHLWSFFASDIADGDRWLVAPLVSHGWTGYDVHFPGHDRFLKQGYYAIESHRFDRVVRRSLPDGAVLTRRKVLGTSARAVVLADGDRVEARGVIDCRGAGDLSHLDCGWQKFLGHEIALDEPHDMVRPTIMDATVEQHDGYRFVYSLPFAATRMFVEDTYYSDTPDIDTRVLERRIAAYVAQRGWAAHEVVRTEAGALPVAMGGNFDAYWQAGGSNVAKAGMRGGQFHPLTGYSLPDAVRTAMLVAGQRDLSGAALHDLLYRHARRLWRQRKFYRLLSRLLLRAAEPGERYRVLERFYRLDAGLIARFYAGRSGLSDKARVLIGRPPVPIGRALAVLRETRR
ncbi:lycopene beta-cyclase CrtY [Stakelama saccharophila]|uniref:Lycopene beta-cyclase CrtY n=1 Tax=Stakelama saccharophila TaxID=3075605 RepID=A0ABZ0B9C7_9SPHN|nr:lycopene beta-cyclase CrtY [Stakelama sp. W311]WNO53822.1 lycopene beta-cyclase CrtY [Stakelama sp. W311]